MLNEDVLAVSLFEKQYYNIRLIAFPPNLHRNKLLEGIIKNISGLSSKKMT